MTDQHDFELEAASAAADDLATPEERALVDASPSARADVESFLALRAQIADVTVPTAAHESAIAAALAAFDAGRSPAATAAATAPPSAPRDTVVSLDSRRRGRGILAAVAAGVAVLMVGAVVLSSRGRDDEDAGSLAPATTAGEVETGDSERSADEGQGVADTTPAATDDESFDETSDDSDDAAGALPAPEPADSVGPDTLSVVVPPEVAPSIESPAELLSYAASPVFASVPAEESAETTAEATAETTAETTAGTAAADQAPATSAAEEAPRVADRCVTDDTEYVGLVLYKGERAYVVRVIATGEIRAHATIDCRLLAFAPS